MTAATFEAINPATLAPLGTISTTAADDVESIVIQIAAVAPLWAQLRVSDRALYIVRIAQAVVDELDAVCEAVVSESGRPGTEVLALELLPAIEQLQWLAASAHRLLSARRVAIARTLQPFKRASAGWAPRGVVAVIGAGSAPFAQPLVEIAAALLAGNGVLFKPAPRAALAGERIAAVFARAGFPEGLLRVVHGGGELGAAITRDAGVAHVFFSGDAAAAAAVAAATAARGASLSSDVAASEAMIVLADARLATAVGGALWAATQSAGQAHGSLRRVYVERPLHDEFIEQLRIAAGKLRVGDPLDPATQLGPLANQRRRERLGEAINAAVAAGAVRVCGEALTVPGLAGAFQSPTILSGSVEQLEPLREAVPGPLVAVSTVANSLEAARLVNAGPQGRSVSIWTSDRRRAARIARELRPSIVWGNDHLPGRSVGENAAEAVRATVRPKLISWDPPAPPAPWRYPYGETSEAALRALAVLKSGRDGDRERALRSGGRALTRVAVRALRGIGER